MSTDRVDAALSASSATGTGAGSARPEWIYIAGPYTHPDPITNTRKAVEMAEQLRAGGCVPVVPHLSMLWHLIEPHDIDFWYEYDLELLARCDHLVRLPGASAGADREVEVARQLGIPVHDDPLGWPW